MKAKANFGQCLHCRRAVPTSEYFMLHDDVWRMVHPTNRGMMHLHGGKKATAFDRLLQAAAC